MGDDVKKITEEELLYIAKRAVNYVVQSDSNLRCQREDLVQEAFIIAYTSLQSYDDSKGASISTYLNNCIKTKLINVIRKNQYSGREISIGESLECYSTQLWESGFEDEAMSPVVFDEIKEYFKSLGIRNLDTILYILERRMNGKTNTEIAKELNVSRTSIAHSMSSFVKKLNKNKILNILEGCHEV